MSSASERINKLVRRKKALAIEKAMLHHAHCHCEDHHHDDEIQDTAVEATAEAPTRITEAPKPAAPSPKKRAQPAEAGKGDKAKRARIASAKPKKELNLQEPLDFGKKLSHTDASVRVKGFKMLAKWLGSHWEVLGEHDARKLWRGLWFVLWMADGRGVQQNTAAQMVQLSRVFTNEEAYLTWWKAFWFTVNEQWEKLDKHRINKYQLLLRIAVAELLNHSIKVQSIESIRRLLDEDILDRKKCTPSVVMHCARVFWDEWTAEIKAADDETKTAVLSTDFNLLRPWIKCVRVCNVKAVVDEIYVSLLLKTPVKAWLAEIRTWMYKIGKNTRTEEMQRDAAYAAVERLEERMKKEGIFSVEAGMESGNAVLQTIQSCESQRAYKLLKAREATREKLSKEKKDLEHQTEKLAKRAMAPSSATSKLESLEAEFNKQTVGLQSRSDYVEKRRRIDELLKADEFSATESQLMGASKPAAANKGITSASKKRKCINKVALSFGDEEEEDESSSSDSGGEDGSEKSGNRLKAVIPKLKKDPNARTDFLPDATRDATLEEDREKLIKEYYQEQEKQKGLPLKITYSYFNGANHRRTIAVTQGCTVSDFLAKCKSQLEADFPELKGRNVGGSSWDELLFVKEDVILPGNLTFHSLIRESSKSS
ncbi:ribosomal RNA-processing protein 1 [Perkinsus chesapeaki]|uniref:Ribosomal RNA-processing protein 1 n=1 Tax=Perkinsus chesapeaki TaxID=330153 RepID=A0A7J6MS96_PERCH|nr:ribosomal RNA-processing protein 1 [Perkinsus chesapeaki]